MIACRKCKKLVRFCISYDDGTIKHHCMGCFKSLAPKITTDFFSLFMKRGIKEAIGLWRKKSHG